jgi:WD40 repeat protein
MLILAGHTGPVLSVAYAPDSLTLASGGSDGSVRIWDLTSGQERLSIPDAGGPVLSLAFSPDGQLLAVGTHSCIDFWDLPTRQYRVSLQGERGGTYVVAFSPPSSTTSLYLTQSDERAGTYVVAFSPTSHRVVLAGYLDSFLTFWEVEGQKRQYLCPGHRGGVLAVAHAANSPWVVSGGGVGLIGELLVWESDSGKLHHSFTHPLRDVPAHTQSVYAVAITPDGETVASGGKDRLVKLWSRGEKRHLATMERHRATVVAVSFPPEGEALLSADEGGLVCLWDVASHRPRQSWDWGIGQLRSVVFAPNGLTAAAGGHRDVLVWDIDEG